MATRDIIRIDEARCDGCGDCIAACAEGAIALVDGKARLVSETYCDGLGACLGRCPRGAITIERVEARPFDAAAVARRRQGPATALPTLATAPESDAHAARHAACPGSRPESFAPRSGAGAEAPSALAHWPVQLHLVSPQAPAFHAAELLLAADCAAYAVGDFHTRFLSGRTLAIACPKLDAHQDDYLAKLVAMIDQSEVRAITVVIMEVPCCSGLVRLAVAAAAQAGRRVPLRAIVVGVDGTVRGEQELRSHPAA